MPKNLGVIIEKKSSDFIGGSLPYKVQNPSADWTNYEPIPENQFSHFADAMACVTYSALNCIETQYKFLTGTEINFSDRFIAKLSGTTPQGNTIQKVLDTIRQYGLVLESDYPAPVDFTWDTYYSEIPAEVMAKAKKYGDKDTWLQYEFYQPTEDYAKQLKHTPLQVIIEKEHPYHAQELVNVSTVFDTYPPYNKPARSIYVLTKIILNLGAKPMYQKVVKKDGKTFGVRVATPNGDQIIYAVDEAQFKSWAKPDSYGLDTVNPDGSTNFAGCVQLPW